jgi:hypothetical protein
MVISTTYNRPKIHPANWQYNMQRENWESIRQEAFWPFAAVGAAGAGLGAWAGNLWDRLWGKTDQPGPSEGDNQATPGSPDIVDSAAQAEASTNQALILAALAVGGFLLIRKYGKK